MMRSKLFVPGSRPELFEKAAGSVADALSFDLEDAVAQEKKTEARGHVASFLRSSNSFAGKLIIVRVNEVSSPIFDADVEAIVGPGVNIINVPKVESAADVSRAVEAIARTEKKQGLGAKIGLLANIETPKGLRRAAEIATADPRVMGLQIGFKDLLSRWGIDGRDSGTQQFVRLQVRLAAAEAGIAAYDGAFTDIKQPDAFRTEAEDARRMGFAGKTCIHPSQVPIANEVFAPRAEEIAYAEKVLAAARDAADRGEAVFAMNGQMIDEPIIAQARATMALVAKLGAARS
jgi:citrate lyase subunit beta / citryl-CoA lyase